MSNSIIGHNIEPVVFTTEWEVEVDDDEYEDMEGELVEEQICLGYRGIVPKNANSTTVTISFYYYAPISEWYWDYNYGIPYKPIIPVVFATDESWNLTECLNSSLCEVSLTGHTNGWVNISVSLIRKLIEGEKIFFGIYSDIIGFVGDYIEDPDTTMCYLYWTRALRRDYNSQIAYLSSPDFIRRQYGIFSDYEICIYLQYENEPDGFFYTRSVIGNVGAAARFNNRKLGAERNSSAVCALGSTSNRIAFFKIFRNENLSFLDSVQKLLLLLRSCVSGINYSDTTSRLADYKKEIESTAGNSESLTRFGENKRNFEDEAEIVARPFASRIFYRTVETVMSFWDWLRGKIREANYVVTLYTPVVLEITLGEDNMKRIYKGKSKLRVLLNCGCDLNGYASVNLVCRKPDDTVVSFPSVVKDADNGIIFYDVQSENDFDQSGWWTFWPEFVFDDDRTSCGKAIRRFVYEVGT